MNALVAYDGSRARLDPSVRSTENGQTVGTGAAAVRADESKHAPDSVRTGVRDVRWFVDGRNAFAFYLIDSATTAPTPVRTTTHVVQRFTVQRGLITELEAITTTARGLSSESSGWPKPAGESDSNLPAVTPPRPVGSSAHWCRDSSRNCKIVSANSYQSSVPTRDYSQTQLAETVRRTQNGGLTASNAAGVRRNGQDPHPDALIIDDRDARWFVDGDSVISFSLVDTSAYPGGTIHTSTEHLANRMRVRHGLIYEIESVYSISPGTTPESSGW